MAEAAGEGSYVPGEGAPIQTVFLDLPLQMLPSLPQKGTLVLTEWKVEDSGHSLAMGLWALLEIQGASPLCCFQLPTQREGGRICTPADTLGAQSPGSVGVGRGGLPASLGKGGFACHRRPYLAQVPSSRLFGSK